MDESVALCFRCGGSNNDLREGDPHNSAIPREMISCDYCVLSWHLDCLDPPLAINPKTVRPTLDGKKKGPRSKQGAHTWMCPNHVASDDPNLEFRQGVSRTINGRIGKLRRPKHATIKDVALRRGFKNNGLIEILNDATEDEEEDGVVYRVSEGGIKLDFIDRVRQYVYPLPIQLAVPQSNTDRSTDYEQPQPNPSPPVTRASSI